MGRTYFISDVHLGEQAEHLEKKRKQNFLQFLKKIEPDASAIFFVGDLFDFWFEYRYVIPKKHFSIIHQLARMRDKGIKITYLAGNHDFWLGNFFDREIGIKTISDEWTGEIDGKRFYLFHGDGIAVKDKGYRFLKRVLRHPWSIRLYRWLHPDWGIPLARFISGSSRQHTNRVNLNDHDDYISFARQKFQTGFDVVIMGHRHQPFILQEDGKTYINLGDWLEHNSYAVFDGKKIELITKHHPS